MNAGKTAVINGMVYYGGGLTDDDKSDHEYIVHCYDPTKDTWATLPPLPVRWFGLGHINGKLVAVGGVKKRGGTTSEVYTYDEQSKKWRQTLPRMPTARLFPGVISLESALVVAGGGKSELPLSSSKNHVEIFKADTSQWYRSDPLPTACRDLSLVVVSNIFRI